MKHPGPQDYNIPSKIVEKPKYFFGLKPFIDPHKCKTTTGPGDYDPKFMDTRGVYSMKEKFEPKGID